MVDKISNEIKNLKLVRNILTNSCLLCFLFQILIDVSLVNIASCSLAFAAFFLTCSSVFNIRNRSFVNSFPASIVFFIISANSFVPMLGTLLEGNSLRTNLEYPIETFFHRFIFALILIVSLRLTNSKLNSSFVFLSKFSEKIKTNRLYSVKIVWTLGLLALFIFFLRFLGLPDGITKILDGFSFLLWSPFILLLPPYTTTNKSKTTNRNLLIYYIIMVLLSFMTNSRMGMIGPILFIGVSYLMVFLTGRIEIKKKIFTKFFIIGIFGIVAMGVFVDLSTAILIERAQRDKRDILEQVSATISTFNNKEALKKARLIMLDKKNNVINGDWKEDYINNDFIARFVQVKFDDNCLSRVYKLKPAEIEKLREISIDKVLVMFPTPIIGFLGLNVDKLYMNSFSMGDMIDVLSGKGFLGGFKTGSIIAHSYGVFSWWYPMILLIIYFLIFRICQYLISRTSNKIKYEEISTLSLILPSYMFTSISLDNVSSVIGVLIRGVWQIVFVYFIALHIAGKINKIIK